LTNSVQMAVNIYVTEVYIVCDVIWHKSPPCWFDL